MANAFVHINVREPKWYSVKCSTYPCHPLSGLPISFSNLVYPFRDPPCIHTNKNLSQSFIFYPLFVTQRVTWSAHCSAFLLFSFLFFFFCFSIFLQYILKSFCVSSRKFYHSFYTCIVAQTWVSHYEISPLLMNGLFPLFYYQQSFNMSFHLSVDMAV